MRLTRSRAAGESPHFWADLQEIELFPGRHTIVVLGESTARGYLYDPEFTPAEGLKRLLGAVLTDTPFQILDFARTNASMDEVLTLMRGVAVLRPRTIVIWAGNNWFPFEGIPWADTAGVVAVIRSGAGALELRAYLEALLRRRVRAFVEEAGSIVRAIGAHAVLVVPEFNLLGWQDALAEPPPLSREGRACWAETRRLLLDAQAAGDRSRIAALADKIISLDGGLGSFGLYTKAVLILPEEPASARALLEEARDAELWQKSPRCHRVTYSELRKSDKTQGFTVVDLPDRFADYCGTRLASRDLFLDYCHHSQQGLRVACASIAEAILRNSFGVSANWHDLAAETFGIPDPVEARAQFLAAAHNSAHAQPEETILRHIRKALESSPEIEAVMRLYACHRLGGVPHALAGGHLWDRQLERYFGPSGISRGPLDLHLVKLITTQSQYFGHMSEVVARHTVSTKAVDLLSPSYRQLVAMDESTLEPCGYYRTRRSVSSFVVVLNGKDSVVLDVSYRTPDAEACSVVQIKCKKQTVARLPASGAWNRVEVTIPASALAPGINLLHIEWPESVLDSHDILLQFADELELGESPVAPYPVLGEIFTLRASL